MSDAALRLSAAAADHAGVKAGEVKTAGEAGVLDLRAAIHDDIEAGTRGDLCRLVRPEA